MKQLNATLEMIKNLLGKDTEIYSENALATLVSYAAELEAETTAIYSVILSYMERLGAEPEATAKMKIIIADEETHERDFMKIVKKVLNLSQGD